MVSIREPLDLQMTDEWSGTTCVTANLLYMFRYINPPIDLAAIDRTIGRAPGQPLMTGGHLLTLLSYGINLTSVISHDIQKYSEAGGREYLIRALEEIGDYESASLHTPQYFKQFLQRCTEYRAKMAKLPGKVTSVIAVPSVDELVKLLKKVPAVIVSFSNENPQSCCTTIAYGICSDGIKFYIPRQQSLRSLPVSTLETLPKTYVDGRLIRGEELIGVHI